jgi:hypothetical protein
MYDQITMDNFIKDMYDFTKDTIIPILFKSSSTYDKPIRSLMKAIIFDVVHEKGWPITQKSLCKNIIEKSDSYPIENYEIVDSKITWKRTKGNDPTTLNNVLSKLLYGFYDEVENPIDNYVDRSVRNTESMFTASKNILIEIGCKIIPSDDYINALVTDTTYAPEYKDQAPNEVSIQSTSYPDNEIVNTNDILKYGGKQTRGRKSKRKSRRKFSKRN